MNSENRGFFANLKNDLPSSIVVFLVALPLCLGIALASEAPLFSGVIAGIVGGVVVTLISGSRMGVSGPAAGLITIVIGAISSLGGFEIFLFAVVIAGVFQLILGFLKAGVIAYYFPSAVIKGMLSGIGLTIILKQLPHAFGYDKDPEGDFAFFQKDGHNTFSELGYMLEAVTPGALIIATVSLVVLILWERPFMKKMVISKVVQGPLVAVVLGVVLNKVFQGIPALAISKEHLVNIPVAANFEGFLDLFTLPDFSQWNNPEVYIVAATIALVASLETLLCVEATDKLDPEKEITPTNRELLAQGSGNIISGLIGGLPITQVIVRSSANIQSGGKSKASAFFHGLLLLACAMFIPNILNMIPYSSLAAVLLLVGYKLAKPSIFKDIYKSGMSQFTPFLITIIGIIFIDLLWGIGLGLIIAIMQILWNNFKRPYHFNPDDYEKGKPVRIWLSQEVTFINKASIMRTLHGLKEGTHVIIDASKTKNIHPDIIEIIEDFMQNAKNHNITLELEGLRIEKSEDPVKQFGHVVLDKK